MPVEHTFRFAPSGCTDVGTRTERLGPARAIRHFCRECYGFCENVAKEIADCPSTTCPLYPFRFGKDPGLSEDQKKRSGLTAKRIGAPPAAA